MSDAALSIHDLEILRQIPTPAVANAIETFNIQPRTIGFMGPEIRQMFPKLAPVIGYAVTARVVCAHEPGPKGAASMPAYWRAIDAAHRTLGPVVMVVEDLDRPSFGAWFGEVNANIHQVLGCVGAITNGGVRDLDEMEALGFATWASGAVVSHGYSHVVDFNDTVRVGGLVVQPGDLLLADQHGVVQIPLAIARAIPEAVRQIESWEQTIIRYCQSPDFSVDGLVGLVARGKDHH
jgi:regulator of RNase E activity RraA